jgi:DNA-binding winged helix-turn-helix (wHTH) protein/predicted ATPase
MLYFFEDFVLDPDRRELRRGGALIAVQPQVFDLLEYLVTNRDRVVSKDDILQAVWGGRIVSESALTTRINAIRTAVGDNGDQQRLIRTLPRKGIRFVGLVQERGRPVDEGAIADAKTPEQKAAHRDEAVPLERRQLTIASCELLLGAAAAGMDPEDLREVIQGYHNCVVETIRRHNGLVANTHGNTAVVYFGYPQAHEDDPERAVRAALELIATAGALKTRTSSQTRVGIATGLVIVGDVTGATGVHERGIIGETPNAAAQLQAIAEPDTVIIADSTRRLLGNLFELDDLGMKDLKGIAVPVRAWTALRQSPAAGRFEAFHATGLTALVGREEELELLMRRWSRAKAGRGQVVLLSGEAGVGKSRLTAALLEAIATEPHTRLCNFCSPQHTDSALYPIIGRIERAAGFTRDDTSQAKLDKLETLLAQRSTSAHDAALFAEMLSLPNDGRYPALELTPQQRRQKTLEALVLQVAALTRENPVLMAFEDAQWIDPTSLELFSRIVDRIPPLRVLLIMTYRPEFQPPWLGRPYVTALTINRLTEREAAAMIDRIVGNKPLQASIRKDIIERSDGIPLFVEEMTKAMLEAGGESKTGKTLLLTEAVPASLQVSLMARLDRLGSAKVVAQIGAVIGRQFPHALIAAVAGKAEPELRSALRQLVEAGLLFSQGVAPHATYLFKHALVQDSAYDTLLREPRRALHAQIVDAVERQFADIAENQPEILARHCVEAGLIEKATAFWDRAGQRSLESSALNEAVEQFTRGLDQIAAVPATPPLRQRQIKLQIGLANSIYHAKGFVAAETKAAFDQARAMIQQAEALGEQVEDPLLLYSVLYGSFIAKFIPFEGDAARALASQFLELARRQKAIAPIMIGHRLLGTTLLCLGEPAEGLKHLDHASALYEPAAHRSLTTHFGHDIGAATHSLRSLALWLLGYPETALAEIDFALKVARETTHAPTLMFTLGMTTFTQICCRTYARANSQINECVALAEETGVVLWNMHAMADRGCVLALVGKSAEGLQTISSVIDGWRSIGATVFAPFWLSHLALAYADLGKFDDASRKICETITTIETSKEKWCEAETNRIAGEIALKSPERDTAKAQSYFERALAVAYARRAKSWELRAAMSLARLWRDQGKVRQARELLAPVHSWFTEGFDTRDLKDAKALLKSLAA